jgi:hypothetical protein
LPQQRSSINQHCEIPALKNLICLLLLVSTSLVRADHDPASAWSWHVMSAGGDESRLAVYQFDRLIGIYDIDCDLTDASAGDRVDGIASINLVKPTIRPQGLLVISCNVGAHSQQISIIDPQHKSSVVAFSVTGSYAATWELQDGELWIGFDEPCDTGPTVECPDGFANTFVQYLPGATGSGN